MVILLFLLQFTQSAEMLVLIAENGEGLVRFDPLEFRVVLANFWWSLISPAHFGVLLSTRANKTASYLPLEIRVLLEFDRTWSSKRQLFLPPRLRWEYNLWTKSAFLIFGFEEIATCFLSDFLHQLFNVAGFISGHEVNILILENVVIVCWLHTVLVARGLVLRRRGRLNYWLFLMFAED
jgi:hypothetical protein